MIKWLRENRRRISLVFTAIFLLTNTSLAVGPAQGTPGLSLNYTITASGTQDITTYPNQAFGWTVAGIGTETWFTYPSQSFYWTVTGTGTETWYNPMPGEGSPAQWGFYESGGAWYKDGKQVTQLYGVSEFRVINGKPFWKNSGAYYFNSMSSFTSTAWGSMGVVTQPNVSEFMVINNSAFWKCNGAYYASDLRVYNIAGQRWQMGAVAPSGASEFIVVNGKAFWRYGDAYYYNTLNLYNIAEQTYGYSGIVTHRSGVSQFRVSGGKPYWSYGGSYYYNTVNTYTIASATFGTIYTTALPLPAPDTYYVAAAFGAQAAPVTGTASGSGGVDALEGNKFISNFNATPQPQHGGAVSGISYSITDDNPNVSTEVSGNGVYASTHVSQTNSAARTATESGQGIVNAPEGSKFISSFSAEPQPLNGGAISNVTYSITDNNPTVLTWVSGNSVYAGTAYSETQSAPWSATESGSGSVNESEGDKLIADSASAAPNRDTVWAVSDDNPFVDTWMVGNQLYARAGNRPPAAQDQIVDTDENTPVSIALGASDPDEDPLVYNISQGPLHGTLSGLMPNLIYTPNASFTGQDAFVFSVSDGTSDSNAATVQINILTAPDTNPPTTPPVKIDNPVSGVISDPIILNPVKPTASVRSLLYSTGASKTTNFRVFWSRSVTALSFSLTSYDVQYKINSGGTWTNWKSGVTLTSAVFNGSAGKTYYFRARAKDNAGNTGDWSSESKTIVPYNEGANINARSGFIGTHPNPSSNFYRGTVKYAAQAGAFIVYRFTGKSVALISTKGKNKSKAKIYIDGIYKATVNAYSSSRQYRRALYSKSWKKRGKHTIKIVHVGNKARFDVDGLGVGR